MTASLILNSPTPRRPATGSPAPAARWSKPLAGFRLRYLPDFLIRLSNGKTLVLEIKGEDSEQNRAKRAALEAWVQAVNAQGGFGLWSWDVAFCAHEIKDILDRHAH